MLQYLIRKENNDNLETTHESHEKNRSCDIYTADSCKSRLLRCGTAFRSKSKSDENKIPTVQLIQPISSNGNAKCFHATTDASQKTIPSNGKYFYLKYNSVVLFGLNVLTLITIVAIVAVVIIGRRDIYEEFCHD